MMGYYLPMRKRQITRLCWDEVDLKENLIRLDPSRNNGGHDFQMIPIHPEVKRNLQSFFGDSCMHPDDEGIVSVIVILHRLKRIMDFS